MTAELVHLMSVISPVADDLAVVFLPLLPVGLWQLLGDLGIRTIDGFGVAVDNIAHKFVATTTIVATTGRKR